MEINNCDGCGGKVEFSPRNKALQCIKCGNLYPIEYKQTVLKHPIDWIPEDSKVDGWVDATKTCKCGVCGAQVTFNKYDIATRCQYCHADALIPQESLPGLRPEKVVPFKIDKSNAKQAFYEKIKTRKFLPNDFKRSLPNIDLGATYLSSFTFEGIVDASYRGRERHTRTVRDSDGRSRTETYYTDFSGQITQQYPNVLIESSDKINQAEIDNILPYDFAECYDYNNDFIKGYNVGYYNKNIKDAELQAKQVMLDEVENSIRRKYTSIDSLTINPTYSNIKYNYTLLPAYFITYDYKNKKYINLMNGQTGALSGKVPRSGIKITLMVLFILLAIGLPVLFIIMSML
ncbi:MAG: hypothetical protein IJA72_04250 [Clostridia bacterium]|nr:hypothetical protein [Clostridia bacterium]